MPAVAIPDSTLTLAALVTWLPFAAFVTIMLWTRGRARLSATLSLAAVTVALAGAVTLLARHWETGQALEVTTTWLVGGEATVRVGFLLDPLSLLMLVIVAAISFLVQVYSLGYMAGDPGFARYYAFMSLFAWAMLNLTLAATLLQLYIFWELVGLASYLLIGFWYEKFSASEAGKKAFVMTRFGDVAFFLGVLLVLTQLGGLGIREMNGPAAARLAPGTVTLAALLIFGGIVGKSAQFPLLTWLPDAMEGPTPVSALLHSATMVAAGVFLLARLFPFFSLSPTALAVCLAVGTISMLIASTMAMVSRDIKRVLGLLDHQPAGLHDHGARRGRLRGRGLPPDHPRRVQGAALPLLGGLHPRLRHQRHVRDRAAGAAACCGVPIVCIVVAAAALVRHPALFAGFSARRRSWARWPGCRTRSGLAAGLLGAFLTTYYIFRARVRDPASAVGSAGPAAHGEGHAHAAGAGYAWMALPLVVLAAATVALGIGEHALSHFLRARSAAAAATPHAWLPLHRHRPERSRPSRSRGSSSAGGAPISVGFVERVPALRDLFGQRWYIDRVYRWLLDHVLAATA